MNRLLSIPSLFLVEIAINAILVLLVRRDDPQHVLVSQELLDGLWAKVLEAHYLVLGAQHIERPLQDVGVKPFLPLGDGLHQTLSRSLLWVEDGSAFISKRPLSDAVPLVAYAPPALKGVLRIVGDDHRVDVPSCIRLQVLVQLLLVDLQQLVVVDLGCSLQMLIRLVVKWLL